jgi:hypothetical protein
MPARWRRRCRARVIARGSASETEGGHGSGGDLCRQAAYIAGEYLFLQRALEGAEPKPLVTKPEVMDREIALDDEAQLLSREGGPQLFRRYAAVPLSRFRRASRRNGSVSAVFFRLLGQWLSA